MITRPRPRSEPTLVISGGTFSEEVVVELVDDCIVPALVDEFLRTRLNLPERGEKEHNVTRL
jgi:hypothetical protein